MHDLFAKRSNKLVLFQLDARDCHFVLLLKVKQLELQSLLVLEMMALYLIDPLRLLPRLAHVLFPNLRDLTMVFCLQLIYSLFISFLILKGTLLHFHKSLSFKLELARIQLLQIIDAAHLPTLQL